MITDLTFLKKFANTPDKIQKYIDLYKESANENIDTIKTGINNADKKVIARAAHQLKTQLNYVGAKSLIDLCARLEDDNEAISFEVAKQLALELISSIEKTFEELK